MKDTGNTMECGACGKPISLTAKFCGKCGAPVKRPAPVAAEETANAPLLQAAIADIPADTESNEKKSAAEVEDLVLTMDIPQPASEHASMLKIDLDLALEAQDDTSKPVKDDKQVVVEHEPVSPAQALSTDSSAAHGSAVPAEWLAAREKSESDIKQLLEKNSQLLDFISLNSQQLSHFQSLPNPTEQLLREMMERQTQLAAQLHTLQEQLRIPPEPVVIKLPDEFKLTLEKQRIELQKSFGQNIAQNATNVEAANQQTLARIEELMAENTQAAKTLESNLAPLSASVNELKTKLQAIGKKVDETAAKSARTSNLKQEDSTEGSGGFIIFVIGLLCGLTVVLSSLAIYNFLSREVAPAAKDGHEAAAVDAGHDKPAHGEAAHDAPAHGEPAHAAPAKEDAGHGSASSHDKPASDSSSKAKSH